MKDTTSNLVALLFVVLQAWVMSKLWCWFLVPLGLVPIGTVTVLGIMLLVNLFRAVKGETVDEAAANVLQSSLGALVVGFGLSYLL